VRSISGNQPFPTEETCGSCLYFFLIEAVLRGDVVAQGVCRWTEEERGVSLWSDACEAYRPVAMDVAARYAAGAARSTVAVG
jgi:hypothetical protein